MRCLSHILVSSNSTLSSIAQKKREKKITQSCENKQDIDSRQLILLSTSITVMDNCPMSSIVHLTCNDNVLHYVLHDNYVIHINNTCQILRQILQSIFVSYLATKKTGIIILCSIGSISAEDFFCQNNCTYFISLVVVRHITYGTTTT